MLTYTGMITRIRYYNEESKFIVATFEANEEMTPFTITGNMSYVESDERYRIEGEFIHHPRYGKQFQLKSYEVLLADDRERIIRYLSSSLFKGIGEKQATAIVDALGEDALKMIKEDASCLVGIKGMNKQKIDTIKQVIDNQSYDQQVLSFFMGHGISTRNLGLIQGFYKEKTLDVLQNNPYQLIDDIDGVGFKSADTLAKKLNFADDHPYRLKAAVAYALTERCFQTGSSYAYLDEIKKAAHRFVPQLTSEHFDEYLKDLLDDHKIIKEDERYYPYDLYDSEITISSLFRKFSELPLATLDEARLEEQIHEVEKQLDITYDSTQKEAITTFMRSPATILTGGPGTGKTTIVKAILRIFKSFYPDDQIDLVAPTGRAAKRLSELTGLETATIHRLLKWDMHTNTFGMNSANPLSTRLLVIDEFSMVDSVLFAKLLEASGHVNKILLIGDDQQLPSVSPGNVLADMIKSHLVPVIELNKIYRQEEGSGIVTLAHALRNDVYDETIFRQYHDIHFISIPNYEVVGEVLDIVKSYIDDGYEDKDIQVLSPMYQGVAGVDALNEALQSLLNPPSPLKDELKVGARIFRVGDKILQLKNRPDDEVFNGDIGTLVEIIKKTPAHPSNTIVCDFDGVQVEYIDGDFGVITHAYCMTVHKSQGNEFPVVIMPVLSDFGIMNRKNLLYTGLSRAKSALYLLGATQVFKAAINRKENLAARRTTLTQRMSDEMMGFSFDDFE
ncbi:ATP-dependent RecD-like DNA helicase [Sharpea azabuensis]|uniref:ATP-dependent RecD2 DNA helicase n=1 Tax=Sharpea porci TaxID=2652286 RepID=A0A844FQ83_9FIRM|nr:ATP-dependent RecD-like DNA helicase [Sharpea porci]MST88078.1 ATP-dependent RecD-like DNA helicase [Sharpea porci]